MRKKEKLNSSSEKKRKMCLESDKLFSFDPVKKMFYFFSFICVLFMGIVFPLILIINNPDNVSVISGCIVAIIASLMLIGCIFTLCYCCDDDENLINI